MTRRAEWKLGLCIGACCAACAVPTIAVLKQQTHSRWPLTGTPAAGAIRGTCSVSTSSLDICNQTWTHAIEEEIGNAAAGEQRAIGPSGGRCDLPPRSANGCGRGTRWGRHRSCVSACLASQSAHGKPCPSSLATGSVCWAWQFMLSMLMLAWQRQLTHICSCLLAQRVQFRKNRPFGFVAKPQTKPDGAWHLNPVQLSLHDRRSTVPGHHSSQKRLLGITTSSSTCCPSEHRSIGS